jgi:hypothetical protein
LTPRLLKAGFCHCLVTPAAENPLALPKPVGLCRIADFADIEPVDIVDEFVDDDVLDADLP